MLQPRRPASPPRRSHLARRALLALAVSALVAALIAPAVGRGLGRRRGRRSRRRSTRRPAAKSRKTVPGVVLVTYRPGTSKADRTSTRRFVHATRGEALSPLSGAAEKVTLPSVVSVDTAITVLEQRPEVRSAEPDYVLRTDASSNDPLLTEDERARSDVGSAVGEQQPGERLWQRRDRRLGARA